MLLQKLKHIKAFVFDVDGVLTNATVLVTETGEQLRTFSIKDGYALQLAVKRGYHVAILTGGRSKGIELRLRGLGISEIFLGLDSKVETYNNFLTKTGLHAENILYMGDDIPDLPVLKLAGLATCPTDAVEEIKAVAHYISPKKGGEGCVRDVIEKVLKMRGDWHDDKPSADDGTLK